MVNFLWTKRWSDIHPSPFCINLTFSFLSRRSPIKPKLLAKPFMSFGSAKKDKEKKKAEKAEKAEKESKEAKGEASAAVAIPGSEKKKEKKEKTVKLKLIKTSKHSEAETEKSNALFPSKAKDGKFP